MINARRTELIINKLTSRPVAVRGSSGHLLPSVVETTLGLFVGSSVIGGSAEKRCRGNLCLTKCVLYVIYAYLCVFGYVGMSVTLGM